MIEKAPQIETDRLLLRGWTKDDLTRWHDVLSEQDVNRFLGGSG